MAKNAKELLELFNATKHNYLKLLKLIEQADSPLDTKILARQVGIELETLDATLTKALGNLKLSWFNE